MWYKKAITLFAFAVFVFQVLPVRQIGNLLFHHTVTEVLADGETDVVKENSNPLLFEKECMVANPFWFLFIPQTLCNRHFYFAVPLPSFRATEVQTPPPNT